MRKLLIICCISTCLSACAKRAKLNKDQMLTTLCNSFQNDAVIEPDEAKVERIFTKHLGPYLTGISLDSAQALKDFFYIRLQRECVEFKDIADRLSGGAGKSDWKDVDIEPASELSQEDYDGFFRSNSLKYLEPDGDTVAIQITDSTWEDHLPDGTYSRLSLAKTDPNEFVITFIESNNIVRQNFSKPGDMYRYKLLKKENGWYLVFTQAVGSKMKFLFKIYY